MLVSWIDSGSDFQIRKEHSKKIKITSKFLKKWNIPQLTGDNVIKQLTNNFYKFWLMKEIEEH